MRCCAWTSVTRARPRSSSSASASTAASPPPTPINCFGDGRWALAFVPGEVPTKLELREPTALAKTDPVFARARELGGGGDWRMSVHRIRLRGEPRHLASLTQPWGEDHEIDDDRRTGRALLDETGQLLRWIHPLELRMESFGIVFVLDLDADGSDEVVYSGSHEFSRHGYLLTTDARGEPSSRVVSGDLS